jgi:hypothetical protein
METEEIPKTSESTTKSDSELQFAPFLFKSFQEVALQLKHNKELTTGFINFLFDLIEEVRVYKLVLYSSSSSFRNAAFQLEYLGNCVLHIYVSNDTPAYLK